MPVVPDTTRIDLRVTVMTMLHGGIESKVFPKLIEYHVGNRWNRPRGSVYRTLARMAFGPVHPGGVFVDYRKIAIPLRDTRSWPRLIGSDEGAVPVLPRTWTHAACLAMDAAVVDTVAAVYGEDNVAHAAARVTRGGDVLAGPLRQASFGEFSPHQNKSQRTLLMRTGPTLMVEVGTMGVLVPSEGKLYLPIPGALTVLEQGISFDSHTPFLAKTPIV